MLAYLRSLVAPRSTYKAMSSPSVAQFVAAAKQAQPRLAGASDKEAAEIAKVEQESEALAKDLDALDSKLTPLTYLVANSPSTADVSLYAHLHPSIVNADPETHPSRPSVLRYFLQVQSLDPVVAAQKALPNAFPPVNVDVGSLKTPARQVVVPIKKEKKAKAPAAEGEAPAKGKGKEAKAAKGDASKDTAAPPAAAAAGAAGAAAPEGKKKEKKEKAPKAQPAKAEPAAPAPSMIDMRVGKVLDVKRHPDADSLYVEQIDVGEEEPRTVCSGLVKYMTEDQIRDQTIVVICNLKPATMRGVKSYAMLLCASSKDGKDEGGIEFVLPPPGSKPGERIYFEGEKYENALPEAQLNPKKKVFETIQPGFTTLDNLEAAWVDPETKAVHRIRTKDGVCKSKSLVGASLS